MGVLADTIKRVISASWVTIGSAGDYNPQHGTFLDGWAISLRNRLQICKKGMYVLLMCWCQYLRRCVNTGGHKGFGWGGGDKELAYLYKYSINAPLCRSRKPPSLTLLAALPHPPPSLSLPSKRGAWERDYKEVSRGTEVHKWSIHYLHSFLCGQTTQGLLQVLLKRGTQDEKSLRTINDSIMVYCWQSSLL